MNRVSAQLWTDGAARGNPGPAAYGIVLKLGNEEFCQGESIGIATNNVAEYAALIAGLELAREKGIKDLEIYLDSELVVKHIKGEYKVKNPGLRPLYEKASSLLADMGYVIHHVPRELNKRADALANLALDRL